MKKNNKDLFIKQSEEKIILFIHGIFASHVFFEPLIKLFLDKGYSIYAVTLKGHGGSYKDLKKVTYKDWVMQIEQIIDKLTSKYQKVYIISHSLGSLLTLISQNVNQVNKTILLAPAIKTKISLKSIKLALKSHRKSVKDNYILYNQKISGVNFTKLYHKFYALKPLIELLKIIKQTKKRLSLFNVDSLIVMSKKDESVRFAAGKYVYDHIISKRKELIILNKSYHSLLDEDEEKKLHELIINFITQ